GKLQMMSHINKPCVMVDVEVRPGCRETWKADILQEIHWLRIGNIAYVATGNTGN
ncbi:hypothetical protein GOODEAATRI_022550, partial [Goodea atripinnis]